MKNLLFALPIVAISMNSCFICDKGEYECSFEDEVSTEKEQIRLSSSDYELNVVEALESEEGYDYYTSGTVEYIVDGTVEAIVDYGSGDVDSWLKITDDGEEKDWDCDKYDEEENEWEKDACKDKGEKEKKSKWGKKDGDKEEYKKVVIRPIVKSDDCDYIVSGIIKYYSLKTGEWTATVDFGDGTCDDIAIKTTAEGDYSFTISDYYGNK